MTSRIRCAILAAVLAAPAAAAPRTRAPMIYLIDYSERFLQDDRAIQAFAGIPPDLVHVGKSVPILHNWGPVPLISGENQNTGGPNHTLSREAIRLLTPQELEARIARLKAYTKQWHDIGVPLLVCYSCMRTLAGDPEKREGFWNFYDHWDDYARWLGPKPADDPVRWFSVDAKGRFLAYDTRTPSYYAPLHRYRACPENPNWRRFQSRLTQLIAEVGYDGVFPDNSNPPRGCCCADCRREFKAFASRLTARELSILGVQGDPVALDLLSPQTPSELVRRYRIDTSARWQRMVRDAGRTVNPKFMVFPNLNSWRDFMPVAESCGAYMFESVYSAGSTVEGKPPEEPFALVAVTADAASARGKYHLEAHEERTSLDLTADLEFPTALRTGQAADFLVRVLTVGSSTRDNDSAEAFEIRLADLDTGEKVTVPLTPNVRVGHEPAGPEAHRPPIELRGRWTAAPGRWKILLAYRYTDPDHLDTTNNVAREQSLPWADVYRTHIGQLLFTMRGPARPVILDYECRRKGAENVQELGLAECAAFSNGGALASIGEPQKKYARFFRRTAQLYEGFTPYADIGLVYSYWGHNPDSMGLTPAMEISPAADLSGRQRLIQVLMDRDLSAEDLRGLRSVILTGDALEISDAGLDALKKFVAVGGKLYLYAPKATLNGKPALDVLPELAAWTSGADVAGAAPLMAAEGFARGLRFSAFLKPEAKRMTLHVLNYNVALHAKPTALTPVENVAISLPLPPGWICPASVKAYDPDTETVAEIPCTQQGDRLAVALPSVRIYKVLEISGK